MKIVFFSNFFNHHQAALSDALWRKTNGEFLFVETCPMPQERKLLGYSEIQREYTRNINGNESLVSQKLQEADLVIAGSAPESLIRQRIKTGKLLFRYSERPLKKGLEPAKYLPRLIRWHWRNPFWKPIYLLCASAYAAGDYAKFGLFRKRTYQWGYFPETKEYTNFDEIMASKSELEILWCGRFLDWKHPEMVLQAAQRLKAEGYSFRVKLIGRGQQEERLHRMVREYRLEDCAAILGAIAAEQVRSHMEQAGIFLCTSDRQEGWGAVLNEAMNSGCAVIAGHAIGAVPFLISNGENGIVYESENAEMLYEKLKTLLEHPEEQKRLGAAAYETIGNLWNAETAADRVIQLAESILAGENSPNLFPSGPCSRAAVINESWKRSNAE